MRNSRSLVVLSFVAALVVLALTGGVSSAHAVSRSCGVVTAAGHPWIVVAKNVPCAKAKSVTRALASRTAALHAGQTRTVASPIAGGFKCVIASKGKPGGSCATAGAAKSILWLAAA